MNIFALELARVPSTSFKVTLRLAKTLIRDKPAQSNDAVVKALAELVEAITESDAALSARVAGQNAGFGHDDQQFDWAIDGLWIFLRKLLELYEVFAHPGFDALPPALAQKAGLVQRRAVATRARKLWQALFATEGTQFTKETFIMQSESMGALMRVIAEQGLQPEIDALVGKGFMPMLEACQQHYETMVSDRLQRDPNVTHNLNVHRADLRWAISAYVSALHTIVVRGKPETAKPVLDALRPILVLRQALSGSSGTSLDNLEDFVELEVDEDQDTDEDDELEASEDEVALSG